LSLLNIGVKYVGVKHVNMDMEQSATFALTAHLTTRAEGFPIHIKLWWLPSRLGFPLRS